MSGRLKNKLFIQSLSIITNINKELEEEFNSKESDNDDFARDDVNKTIINSIFSLLNFQITIINQLAELNYQFLEKNDNNHQKIIEKLVNFTKELLYQKIKQILMLNHNNNIIYKNYIDNSSSLKINNDKIKKKKKQLININEKKFDNNDSSMENDFNSNIVNKTLDMDLNKNIFKKRQLIKTNYSYEKKNNFIMPFLHKEKINTTKYKKKLIKTNLIKNRNSKNDSKILKNTFFGNRYTSQISKKKFIIKSDSKNKNTSLSSEKISFRYIKGKSNAINNLNISQENEESNPIRKVNNIIKNIKINNSSVSTEKNINNKRNKNLIHGKSKISSLVNYSIDSNNNQEKESENNENVKNINFNNKRNNENNEKDIETSHILYKCMNNVKKRLMAIENEKHTKKEVKINMINKNSYEYKTMKHHKIKRTSGQFI